MNRPQTLQDYFDIAWDHAVVKKSPPCYKTIGVKKIERCLYRDPKTGNRCLVGAAIRDEDYTEGIELKRASAVLYKLGYEVPAGINDLQSCHDTSTTSANYTKKIEEKLRGFAEKYNLTIPVNSNETNPK